MTKATNKIERQEYRVCTESWYCTVYDENQAQRGKKSILLEAYDDYDSYLGGITFEEFEGMAWIEVIEHTGIGYKENNPLGFDELKEQKKTPIRGRKMIREIQTIKQVIVQTENESELDYIRSPLELAKFAQPIIGDLDREVLLAVLLNTKNRIIGIERVSVGALNSTIVHPREVMKGAILNNSATFALVHQHPSNECQPSNDDIEVTKRMKEVGEIIGIPLLDHVIVGYEEGNYISLKQQGYC